MFYDFVGISSMPWGDSLFFKSLMFVLMNNSYFELVNDLYISGVTLVNALVYASASSD
jgi:hypothetical protein